MSWDRIEGNWKQFSGKAKQRWGDLTEDDLTAVDGRREHLSGRIQDRYGIAQDLADGQIDEWLKEPGVLDDWNDRRAI